MVSKRPAILHIFQVPGQTLDNEETPMKKALALLCALPLSAAFGQWKQDKFIITATMDPMYDPSDAVWRQRMADFSAANFNTLGGVQATAEVTLTTDRTKKALSFAPSYNLRALVGDSRLWYGNNAVSDADINAVMAVYGPNSTSGTVPSLTQAQRNAIFGYISGHEPGVNSAAFQNVLSTTGRMLAKDPSKLTVACLTNVWSNQSAADYRAYVKSYVNIAPVLSYDYYIGQNEMPYLDARYYETYQIAAEEVRNKINASGLPRYFWSYPLSAEHWANNCSEHFYKKSDAQLRHTAFVPLLYGAKGLAWFTYWSHSPSYPPDCVKRENGGAGEAYADALIRRDGSKNDLYYKVKEINGRILDMGPMLMSGAWGAAYHGGYIDPNTGESGLPMPGSSVFVKSMAGTNPDNMMAGRLTTSRFGGELLLMLNKNYVNPVRTQFTLGTTRRNLEIYREGLKDWVRPAFTASTSSDFTFDLSLDAGDMAMALVSDAQYRMVDLNKDGMPDQVRFFSDHIDVVMGALNGNGTLYQNLKPATGYVVGKAEEYVFGEFNSTKGTELVHVVPGKDYIDILAWNNSTHTFSKIQFRPWAGYNVQSAKDYLVGDFNKDGYADLAQFYGPAASLWMNQRNNTFIVNDYYRPSSSYPTVNAADFQVGDFDGDGYSDLIHFVPGLDYAYIWSGVASGYFSVSTFQPWAGYTWRSASEFMVVAQKGGARQDLIHNTPLVSYSLRWISTGRNAFNVIVFAP